jgi:hypothetical protein
MERSRLVVLQGAKLSKKLKNDNFALDKTTNRLLSISSEMERIRFPNKDILLLT